MNLAVARVTETGLPLIYCNQVGGQDELVFDGASFVLNADRRLAAQAKAFEEDLLITRWRRGDDQIWACVEGRITPPALGPRGGLSRDVPGPSRLCRQERLSGRGARPFGRHRFGALGRGGGGCARAGSGCTR